MRTPVRRVLPILALLAGSLGQVAPAHAAPVVSGSIWGVADDPLGSGKVFIVAFCTAGTTSTITSYITVVCNAYQGGPEGGGGTGSSGPSRNLGATVWPCVSTVCGNQWVNPTLGHAWPFANRGFSYWVGSSGTPAYVCENVTVTYTDGTRQAYQNCTRLAA